MTLLQSHRAEDVSKKGDTSQSDVEVPDTDPSQYDGVVVVFGRFNPQQQDIKNYYREQSQKHLERTFALKVYPSRTQDKKKNPLEPGTKIEYMRKMFDDVAEDIVDDPNAKTIFDVMVAANELGFTKLNIMVDKIDSANSESCT